MGVKMVRKAETVQKRWGTEHIICNNDKYCGKILTVSPGWKCSYHRHPIKAETFFVLFGIGVVVLMGDEKIVMPGDIIDIPTGAYHEFAAFDRQLSLSLIEVSSPHSDNDVQRLSESRELSKSEKERYEQMYLEKGAVYWNPESI